MSNEAEIKDLFTVYYMNHSKVYEMRMLLNNKIWKEATSEEDKALLIGNGLKLRLLDENASPYTFNKYAEYADFTSDMLVYEKTYTAELSSIAGTPIEAGPFDTVVLFKINYN